MKYQHKELAAGRWKEFPFFEQMANIGSEVERAISWKEKGNPDYGRQAFYRALELMALTIDDEKNKKRLKELTRTREVFIDWFAFDNIYHSTAQSWRNYFYPFNFAARRGR